MKTIDIKDLYDIQPSLPCNNKLVNIRGCNGAGKSSIPLNLLNTDPYSFEVLWFLNGKQRVLATVFPSYQYLSIGSYRTKCGGLDTFKTTDQTKLALDTLWNFNYNIIMEGIMASTVRQTYIDLFHDMNDTHEYKRDVTVFSILPPLSVCLQRIQKRNGGKAIDEKSVESKWKTVERNVSRFQDAGFKSLKVSNAEVASDENLNWFFSLIGDDQCQLPKKVLPSII